MDILTLIVRCWIGAAIQYLKGYKCKTTAKPIPTLEVFDQENEGWNK